MQYLLDTGILLRLLNPSDFARYPNLQVSAPQVILQT
jgi:hypothetical protein